MGSGVCLSVCPGASRGVGQAGAEVGASGMQKNIYRILIVEEFNT